MVPPPDEIVRTTATETLAEIHSRNAEFAGNPEALYLMIEQRLLPHFDFTLISRQVLGRHWSDANAEQRMRFSAAFRRMLVKTYAKALLAFQDDAFEWMPVRMAPDASDAVVKSLVKREGAPALTIAYKLHLTDGRWLVQDITIDGVSLVNTYRGQFTHQIRQTTLDQLIQKLEEKASGVG
jgi:phospholipid transport system substrate-binding protein